jgi:hypothetical protein
LTTPTRNLTISGLDTRSRTRNSSTVPVFPCHPLRVCSAPHQPITSVQVAVTPRETPALPPRPRTIHPTPCPTARSTLRSNPPSTTRLRGI